MTVRKSIALLASCSVLMATPAFAGDTEAALAGAVLGNVLGGKTALENGAGELEGAMISSRLMLSAAAAIFADGTTNSEQGILLVGDETIDLSLPDDLMNAMQWHQDQLAECENIAPEVSSIKYFGLESDTVGAVADAVKGAPAPSTTHVAYVATVADSELVAAVQAESSTRWVRVADVSRPGLNTVSWKWAELQKQRARAGEGKCAASDKGKARIASFDEFSKEVTALGKDGAPSVLFQAQRIAVVNENNAKQGKETKVLRLKVEKAGGSVINTDNLLTRLGMPAVSVTGAAIVSYRLIDPATGRTLKSDILVCWAPRQRLGTVHKGNLPEVRLENCKPRPPVGRAAPST